MIFAAILPGCSQKRDQRSENLVYWSSNNQNEIEFANAMVSEWNRRHPDQPIHTQPVPEGQSSEEVILAAVVGKTTPDIYSNMWQGDVEGYARAGAIVPLDTLPGFNEFLAERCDSAVIAEVTSSDGHIYQIPWKINPIMLIYNVKEMQSIGFARAPVTYSQFLEAGKRFQEDRDGDGYVDRWIGYANVKVTWWLRLFDFYPFYLAASNGGHLIQNNKVVFNNQYAVEVFRFLRTLYKKNYFTRERLDTRSDVFLAGDIASKFTGPWEITRIERYKSQNFDYGFSQIPTPDSHRGNVYTYADPKNMVIFSTTKNPLLAWQFIKFMISKENDLRLLEMTHQLPRRRNLFRDAFFAEFFARNPRMIPFAKQAKYVRGPDLSPVLKEIFDIISQEYEACVIYGVKSPEKAIQDAARAARLLLM